jgi:hypothetical protein
LYNLSNDIRESVNLAKTDAKRAVRLRRMLDDWRRSVHASMPTPNPNYDPAMANQGLTGEKPLPAKAAGAASPIKKTGNRNSRCRGSFLGQPIQHFVSRHTFCCWTTLMWRKTISPGPLVSDHRSW